MVGVRLELLRDLVVLALARLGELRIDAHGAADALVERPHDRLAAQQIAGAAGAEGGVGAAVVADGRRTQAVLDDVDQLLALLGRDEAFGGVELDAIRRKALERHPADLQRTLGDLGREALFDQRIEEVGGRAAALNVLRDPVLPFLRKVGACHPQWTALIAGGSRVVSGVRKLNITMRNADVTNLLCFACDALVERVLKKREGLWRRSVKARSPRRSNCSQDRSAAVWRGGGSESGLPRSGPPVRRDVEGNAFGIEVLHLVETAALGGLPHPVLPAGGLDRRAGRSQVFDVEAEVVHAHMARAQLAGVALLLVMEQRQVHHAVA